MSLPVLVVRPHEVQRMQVSTEGLGGSSILDRALGVATSIGDFVAVVAGDLLDVLEQILREAIDRDEDSTGLMQLLGRASWEAKGDWIQAIRREIAVVLGDATLESALFDDDQRPALMRRVVDGRMVGLLVRPDLDPGTPPNEWANGDIVRRRERKLLEQGQAGRYDDRLALGAQTLISLAEQAHSGWMFLPSLYVHGDPWRSRLEAMGFIIGEQLAVDGLFCPARLPAGWSLELGNVDGHVVDIVARNGLIRAQVTYVASQPGDHAEDRFASLRIVRLDDGSE